MVKVSDKAVIRAGFAEVFRRANMLGVYSEMAVRELAIGMAYVILSRDTKTSFMKIDQATDVLMLMAEESGLDPMKLRNVVQQAHYWKTNKSPLVSALVRDGDDRLGIYVELFSNAMDFAAQIEPVDLSSISTAAILSAVQQTASQEAGVVYSPVKSHTVTPSVSGELADAFWTGKSNMANAVIPMTGDGYGMSAERTEPLTTESVPVEAAKESLADLYAELDALVGLTVVKEEIHKQAELLRVQKLRTDAGLASPDITRHLVFTGNPGTGKTTVARLVSRIYRAIGVLPKGHLIEVDKSGLVAGYVGQSEEKTASVIKEALGGVLFIDEAYALTSDEFGRTVVDLLVKAAEDHRDDFVIILAGYTGPMQDFIEMNPGLTSRFRTIIEFPDYSDEELVTIFERMVDKSDYECDPAAFEAFRTIVSRQNRDEHFGNARFARNCFEAAIMRHAWRLKDVPTPTMEQLVTLTSDDVLGAVPNRIELPPDIPQ